MLFYFSFRSWFFVFLSTVLFFSGPSPAKADEPLARPEVRMVCSLNMLYCAELDPRPPYTTVFHIVYGDKRQEFWSMPGWFRMAALSSNGEYLMTGYDGIHLLPLDYRKDEPMLTFYHKGELIRVVRLKDIIFDFSKLKRTESHYYWGSYQGIDMMDRYIVETVEGYRFIFDMKKGNLISRKKLTDD
jgi:hypothetical protein